MNSELILERKKGREAAEGTFKQVTKLLSEVAITAFCQHMTKLCSEAWVMPTPKAKAFERTACRVPGLMKFKISLYPSEEGFAVCVPRLPGCWSQGATEAEALENIASAIHAAS